MLILPEVVCDLGGDTKGFYLGVSHRPPPVVLILVITILCPGGQNPGNGKHSSPSNMIISLQLSTTPSIGHQNNRSKIQNQNYSIHDQQEGCSPFPAFLFFFLTRASCFRLSRSKLCDDCLPPRAFFWSQVWMGTGEGRWMDIAL